MKLRERNDHFDLKNRRRLGIFDVVFTPNSFPVSFIITSTSFHTGAPLVYECLKSLPIGPSQSIS